MDGEARLIQHKLLFPHRVIDQGQERVPVADIGLDDRLRLFLADLDDFLNAVMLGFGEFELVNFGKIERHLMAFTTGPHVSTHALRLK